MSGYYRGVCIDGPNKGEVMTSRSPDMKAAIRPKLSFHLTDEPQPELALPARLDTVDYRYVTFTMPRHTWHDDGEHVTLWDEWVPGWYCGRDF